MFDKYRLFDAFASAYVAWAGDKSSDRSCHSGRCVWLCVDYSGPSHPTPLPILYVTLCFRCFCVYWS
jgi:hypothetical protein